MSDPIKHMLRSDSVYLSRRVRRALAYVPRNEEVHSCPDALADDIIAEWLQVHYPQILNFLDGQEQNDKVFRETLKPKTP